MSLAQWHYTSAPPGPDGSGFRFTAVTPGLPDELLKEVEQLIGYEPPHDAPSQPTDTELAALPEAFSHSVLSDGTRLLARTVPTGADHSGRGGNFHAHAVRLPASTALSTGAGSTPISAWNSPQWATVTPVGGVPAPLEAPPAGRSFDRRELVTFAASRAPWLAVFFAGLRELSEEAAAPRIVLVERDSEDVARWIALASAVLPGAAVHRLTFTTYTRRPHLAGQQILGVLPEDARSLAGQDHLCRVLDPAGPAPAGPVADTWAVIAARVWLARAPELFTEAAALPGGPLTAGPLAVAALCAGIAPEAAGRAAAADWARKHTDALDDQRLRQLVDALCAPAEDRTPAETAALAGLLTALDGRAPAATTAPLAALVLTEAVRAPASGTPSAGTGLSGHRLPALPEDLKRRLAAELAPELRAGIVGRPGDEPGGAGTDTSRPVELLRVAELLGMDSADLLPGLAQRLAHALIADPEPAYTPAVRTVLEEHFDLRTALLSRLDALAADDPPAAARLLARTSLPFDGIQTLPHLRMCAEAPAPAPDGGDRVTALHSVLRAAGASPLADPLVLRTAVRLVWDGGTPTASEARLMLAESGSDAHRAAGTWSALVKAALDGPGDRADAPELAHDLLRSFPEELEPRVRGALQLLDFARDLRAGRTGSGWTARALTLRSAAEPVEPGVLLEVFGTLARALLSEERPEGELYALAHCGDTDLTSAYRRAAHEEWLRDRLRTVPAHAADCFTAWTSLPGANRTWDEIRTTLLDKVLRPVVRTLPAEDLAAVERHLERTGGRRAEEFRTWNRPGALGRLGLRLGGRGRRQGG
ncbi:GTPase-associated protein 1-related protein [Streptomyces sp. AK02-01A]|uniref:GTPase-associated protein 1-related protein n=1 Tax=Streptomyces sp. AK02-01A TaxID=3028648 RepID=UPI0029BBD4DD|nr:GTPase-associated protein 1-related protein [Streptomyces sp. AK02-01A]MDX3850709.1 GTPase-associated protein 1-related protein [Streptomyces sp. AK02-01A]